MRLLLCFFVVFIFVMICVVGVAFCGGMTFGTAPFGWLMGVGVFVAIFAGIGACSTVEEYDNRKN